MATHFAALIYRPEQVSDRALSQGFAVALAGFDVAAPRLLIAAIPGLPAHRVAFYESGSFRSGEEDDELDHACELFEGEVPPALGVLDAAAEAGRPDAVVHAITYAEAIVHDDAWRFDAHGYERHFVHDDEWGVQTPERDEVTSLEVALGDDATDDEDYAAVEREVRPNRGSTYLSSELGAPVLAALVGALYSIDRRLDIRLVEASPVSIAEETTRLNRVLRRIDGRGAFAVPSSIHEVVTPPVYEAFVQIYDWLDPTDPHDAYRGLALGRIEGTLRFLREDELAAVARDPHFARAAAQGVFPIARLSGSALGQSGTPLGIIALAANHDDVMIVRSNGNTELAGPTFGELLRYLALGWKQRSAEEEELIGALMLRAKVRS